MITNTEIWATFEDILRPSWRIWFDQTIGLGNSGRIDVTVAVNLVLTCMEVEKWKEKECISKSSRIAEKKIVHW